MIDLADNFKQWLLNDFEEYLKNVPLADLNSYVKRDALPAAKKEVSYYEDHLEKEQKRGIGVKGYNFILEKIHLYERYVKFLENVLQHPAIIDFDEVGHPLIQDEKKYNKIIQKFRDKGLIQGRKWKGKKQELWALAYYLIHLKVIKNLPKGKLYEEFSKQFDEIGDEKNLRRIFEKMEARYVGKIEDAAMIELLSKIEEIAEEELESE
jgi:hypothetical protein